MSVFQPAVLVYQRVPNIFVFPLKEVGSFHPVILSNSYVSVSELE